jgi:hypothetical protein
MAESVRLPLAPICDDEPISPEIAYTDRIDNADGSHLSDGARIPESSAMESSRPALTSICSEKPRRPETGYTDPTARKLDVKSSDILEPYVDGFTLAEGTSILEKSSTESARFAVGGVWDHGLTSAEIGYSDPCRTAEGVVGSHGSRNGVIRTTESDNSALASVLAEGARPSETKYTDSGTFLPDGKGIRVN